MADETPDLTDAIADVANAPKRTKIKSTEVEEQDLDAMIRADRHLKAQVGSGSATGGLRISIMRPGGTG